MQRKVFFIVGLLILAFCASASRALGQVKGSLWPDRFDTQDECMAALSAGHVRYYQPSFFKPKRLADGERAVPLEAPACVRMQIVGRIAWVPQAVGTEFIFRGSTANRRKDCGNRVYAVEYLKTRFASNPNPLVVHDTIWRYEETDRREHGFLTPEEEDHGMPGWQKGTLIAVGTAITGYVVHSLWPRSHHVEVNVDIRSSLSALMSAIR